MNLKPEELVKALREDCKTCSENPICENGTNLAGLYCANKDAADQIERDQKEIKELRAALEKATEMADALNKKCDLITKKLEQLSGTHSVVGDSKGGHAMNEPLTLQER